MSSGAILLRLVEGVGWTLAITMVCSATALVAGLALAGLRRSQRPVLVALVDASVFALRGVPVLVALFLVYFGLPGFGLAVPPLVAMALSLGLISGAYLAEVFRSALASVEASEVLAAQSAGFSRLQVLRLVEFPQMLRLSVPGMINEFTTILKYSPFGFTVGVPEITRHALAVSAETLRGTEVYLAVGVLYFAIYRVLVSGLRRVEKRFAVPGLATVQEGAWR